MSEEYHPVVHNIQSLLEEHNVSYEVFEHDPVVTSEEAAAIRGNRFTLSEGTKALIIKARMRDKTKKFFLFAIPGDAKFDVKKARRVLDAKSVSFATKEEADEYTDGVEFGGVAPLGSVFNLPLYADEKVLENDTIIFNAGDRRVSIAIKSDDWRELEQPEITSLV